MNIHLICTGTELLNGGTLNTNLAFIGEVLRGHGYSLRREVCVPDGAAAIGAAVREELQHADLVVTIGGLGPTSDDLTRDVVADVLGVKLHLDAAVLATIEAYLRKRGARVTPQSARVQAMVPAGATVLPNPNGTAPGLWCPAGAGRAVVMLPGPPVELKPMFVDAVLPLLRQGWPPELCSASIRVCGVPEPTVADAVDRIVAACPGVTPAYCARPGLVEVHLTAPPVAIASLADAERQVRNELGEAALPPGCSGMVEAVGNLLRERRWSLATAESCTGGALGALLTDRPGASDFFRGALVTYANEWKTALLSVCPETLAQHGAVSAATAAEMLDGLLSRPDVDAAIAITGIAGPDGGSAEKPVGLVFIGTGVREHRRVQRHLFPGSRETVRQRAAAAALNQLRFDLLHYH